MCLRCAGWTYTMGLRWRHRHPELIVVGMDPVEAHHLLGQLIERIVDGEVARPGALVVLPDAEVTFGHVHHRNLVGEWFTQWPTAARACGEGTTSLRALQVRLDQLDGCDICFDRQRALERPGSASALAAVRHPEPTA